MTSPADVQWLDEVKWNNDGLVAAIAQDVHSGRVLMMAWMNPESLQLSVAEGRAVYWSRSRQALWRKGESSGHVQTLHDIALDCDGDALLLQVEQIGLPDVFRSHGLSMPQTLQVRVGGTQQR